jgi:hypothetical protein
MFSTEYAGAEKQNRSLLGAQLDQILDQVLKSIRALIPDRGEPEVVVVNVYLTEVSLIFYGTGGSRGREDEHRSTDRQ